MIKKIMYFMPDNPISGKAGNITRLNQILDFFNKSQDLQVTFVSLQDWGMWTENDKKNFHERYPKLSLEILDKKHKKSFFKYFFLYKIPYLWNNSIDLSSYILRKNFKQLTQKIQPNIIVTSYASWGNILPNNLKNCYKIIDTHDFITAQNSKKENKIGRMFQDEISILKKYNEILTYSVEEKYIFEQFTKSKVTLVPISFPTKENRSNFHSPFDIIYVASDNPHNVSGIQWFIDNVLPLLPKEINLHVIGKICSKIDDSPNIIKHGMVDNLDEMYWNSKISICPMLSGTGIKIKVLEALSFGLPVVTNTRGIDGLINKQNNGCLVGDTPEEFAEHIKKLLSKEDFYILTQNMGQRFFTENYNEEVEMHTVRKIFTVN